MDHLETCNQAYDALLREQNEYKVTNRLLKKRLVEAEVLITDQVKRLKDYDEQFVRLASQLQKEQESA